MSRVACCICTVELEVGLEDWCWPPSSPSLRPPTPPYCLHLRYRLVADIQSTVIQRDLKSANCLIDEHLHIKIADFGLSRRLAPGNMETYCGTPANMAPEIVKQEEYSEKADVFSFAIILWELVTGENPYPTISGMALAFAVANRLVQKVVHSLIITRLTSPYLANRQQTQGFTA